jgi:hypothetical protein
VVVQQALTKDEVIAAKVRVSSASNGAIMALDIVATPLLNAGNVHTSVGWLNRMKYAEGLHHEEWEEREIDK